MQKDETIRFFIVLFIVVTVALYMTVCSPIP